MTEIDVVDYLLNKDTNFLNSYDLYQDISKQMQITLSTLKKYSKYI